MNRNDIIQYLENMNLPTNEFIILAGAALVLYGIKETTHDIDIAVSKQLEMILRNNYTYQLEVVQNGKKVYYINHILNFSQNLYDVDYTIHDGYHVQTIDSIIALKKRLNREKDVKDIKYIERYMREHSNESK